MMARNMDKMSVIRSMSTREVRPRSRSLLHAHRLCAESQCFLSQLWIGDFSPIGHTRPELEIPPFIAVAAVQRPRLFWEWPGLRLRRRQRQVRDLALAWNSIGWPNESKRCG